MTDINGVDRKLQIRIGHVNNVSCTTNTETTCSGTFSTPFSNNCLGIWLNATGGIHSVPICGESTVSKTGFTAIASVSKGNNIACTFHYIAIGY